MEVKKQPILLTENLFFGGNGPYLKRKAIIEISYGGCERPYRQFGRNQTFYSIRLVNGLVAFMVDKNPQTHD